MHSLDDCAEHVKNDRPLYERLFKTFNRLGDLAKAYGATVFGGDYQQAVGALAPFRYKVGLPDASNATMQHIGQQTMIHSPRPLISRIADSTVFDMRSLSRCNTHNVGTCTEASRTQVSALMEDIWEYESDSEARGSVESDADEGDYIIRLLLYQSCKLFTLSHQLALAKSQP